jgi:hypothetical protein
MEASGRRSRPRAKAVNCVRVRERYLSARPARGLGEEEFVAHIGDSGGERERRV